MTLIKEMADAVEFLSDLVKNTRDLATAVKDGRDYLTSQHPEAKADLVAMLGEMQTTIEGLARVTSVVTGFRFTTSGSAVDDEPSRFNDYVIGQKEKVAALRGSIRTLKGNCDRIRVARDKLNSMGTGWTGMFRLFNLRRRETEQRLANALSLFYADDQAMLFRVEQILDLSETALAEADDALGPRGSASPHRIGGAAAVLNVYADAFRDSAKDLNGLVRSLEEAAAALS